MYTIRMTLPPLLHQSGTLWKRVLPRFQKEAGALVVEAIKAHLGNDVYTLSENYAKRKPHLGRYKHVAGKPADQPLILTGDLFTGVEATVNGDLLEIGVAADHGLDKRGDDYAEAWEDSVHYLDMGMKDVEDQLPGLLETIIVQEMLLDL